MLGIYKAYTGTEESGLLLYITPEEYATLEKESITADIIKQGISHFTLLSLELCRQSYPSQQHYIFREEKEKLYLTIDDAGYEELPKKGNIAFGKSEHLSSGLQIILTTTPKVKKWIF